MSITQNGSTGEYGGQWYTGETNAYTNNGDLLVVSVGFGYENDQATISATYGGQAMTKLAEAAAGSGDGRAIIFYLANPPTGSNNIVINWTGGDEKFLTVIVSSWDGIDTTTPFGTPAADNGSDTTPTVDVSSASGELVIDSVSFRDSAKTLSVGASQTQTGQTTSGSGTLYNRAGQSTEAGATTVTMSWSISASVSWGWFIVAGAMKPAAGAAPGPQEFHRRPNPLLRM